jgi:hypothetical protein
MGFTRRHAVILMAAFLAMGLWRAELFLVRGWLGLQDDRFSWSWESGFNWAAIPICALIASVCAFSVHPFYFSIRPFYSAARLAMFVTMASIMFLAAFVISKAALDNFFAFAFSHGAGRPAGLIALLPMALSGVAVSVVLPLLAREMLAPVQLWTMFALAAALVLIMPLSALTFCLLADSCGQMGINDIKLGYPIFWTALLVPLVLELGSE